MGAFDTLTELPSLAHLKVTCSQTETPPGVTRTRSMHATGATTRRTTSFTFSNCAGDGKDTTDGMDDEQPENAQNGNGTTTTPSMIFSGLSPTPSNFGVSPLSASPVDLTDSNGKWTSDSDPKRKGKRVSPVSVLMIPALDLSVDVSFDEDEGGDDVTGMECDASGNDRTIPQTGPRFGASPSFTFTENTGPSFGQSNSFKVDADCAKTPKGNRLNAHINPNGSFGTPDGGNNDNSTPVQFGFGNIPPTPVRPRRLDEDDGEQFGNPTNDCNNSSAHSLSEDEDDWQLSDDSLSSDDLNPNSDVQPVPLSFGGMLQGVTSFTSPQSNPTGTQLETQLVSNPGKPPRRHRRSKSGDKKRKSDRFRAPKLVRHDSLSQTKLLAQAGLHRSASLKYSETVGEMNDEMRVKDIDVDGSGVEANERNASTTTESTFTFESHFEFLKVLGRTPTSEAWLVKSKVSGVKYCVKRITQAFRNVSEREELLHEVVSVTNLPAHENVVKYHRAWQEDRHFFTQIEVCERGSFGQVLEKLKRRSEEVGMDGMRSNEQKFSETLYSKTSSTPVHLLAERDVWRFAVDVASGLAHCHTHGVLHLDIKPDNVFISSQGCYKIGDFGVAWIANKGWEVLDGDGGFVAPEVLRGAGSSVEVTDYEAIGDGFDGLVGMGAGGIEAFGSNPPSTTTTPKAPTIHNVFTPTDRADVFSFGASLYEASCGERLPSQWRLGVPTWEGVTQGVTLNDTPSIKGVTKAYWDGLDFPGRSDELRKYVTMCLRSEPSHRPSASDLAKHASMILAQGV